jgi:hypothetical protein
VARFDAELVGEGDPQSFIGDQSPGWFALRLVSRHQRAIGRLVEGIGAHLASQIHLTAITHDVFDNAISPSPSHSPYGPIQSFEPRKRERRNLAEVINGHTSAIAMLRTQRGLVIERVSTSELELGRFASLWHTELRPDEVPQGVLTAAEEIQHRADFDARRALARPYTNGGYDG